MGSRCEAQDWHGEATRARDTVRAGPVQRTAVRAAGTAAAGSRPRAGASRAEAPPRTRPPTRFRRRDARATGPCPARPLAGLAVPGNIGTIEGGPGSDTIDLQDSSLETLDIRTGSGSDTVQFVFMVVNGDTAISLGPGADTVDIDGCCSVFNADLHIED